MLVSWVGSLVVFEMSLVVGESDGGGFVVEDIVWTRGALRGT